MSMFQVLAFTGGCIGLAVGIKHGSHHGLLMEVLYGLVGTVVGFIAGILLTPVLLFVACVEDAVKRKVRSNFK